VNNYFNTTFILRGASYVNRKCEVRNLSPDPDKAKRMIGKQTGS